MTIIDKINNRFGKPFLYVIGATIVGVLFLLMFLDASEIDNMIPPAQLVGAVQNVDVTISGRIKKCTEDSNSSFWIKATGIVPFDIKREQVKPTLLAVFKATKIKYPHCEKIFVELAPSQELAETLNLAGRIEYEKGILKLNYSIPSNQQIEEYNSKIGKSEPSISLKKETFFELDYKNMQINNNLPFPPTKEAFDVGKKIVYAMADPALMKYKSEQRFKIISKNMGLTEKEAKRYDRLISHYYSFAGSGRGEETMHLK